MAIGVDVSEFQGVGTDYREFVIVRAANGRREDYRVDGHISSAQSRGTPVSLYTYCEPGGPAPEAQADRMCDVADRRGIRATLWADIEEGGGDLRWFEDRFVARCNARGYACGVYSGDYFWNAHNLSGDQGRWKAAYGPNDGGMHNAPRQPYDIWQFSSLPYDTNVTDPSVVVRLFNGGAAPAPPAHQYNPGVTGMLLRDQDTGAIYLVGPGHAHHVATGDDVNRLRYIGVPYAGDQPGLAIVGWGRTFGVPDWDQTSTWA